MPDINFVDTSITDLLATGISNYQQTYFNLTGQQVTVQPGDNDYIRIYAQATILYSMLQTINTIARQNFLKYSTGNNLRVLAANTGTEASAPQPAVTSIVFTLGNTQATQVTIPTGTRGTAGDGVYFATDEDCIILPGSTTVNQSATCTITGAAGNGYPPGQIDILVDSVPSALSALTVSNTETTEGGSDEESDLSLAEKTFAAPGGYSVAGPSGAYDYWARQYNSSVIDTEVVVPTPGVVNQYVLLTGGTLPDETFLTELTAYVGAADKRPLTDNYSAMSPTVQNYDINLTYYIDPANAGQAATIQAAVTAAVAAFQAWTQGKIGRDVIPDQLTSGIIQAGAKRVVMTSPVFSQVAIPAVAVALTVTVTYGGIDSV